MQWRVEIGIFSENLKSDIEADNCYRQYVPYFFVAQGFALFL